MAKRNKKSDDEAPVPRKSGGEHTTPRKPVQFPKAWYDVAKKCAAKAKQPILWYLMDIIAKDAARLEVAPLPPFPWEDGEIADTPVGDK